MQKLYIALVDTPGLFAWIIRRVIKINYIHVVLSLDASFREAYSVGRRNPFIPFFAGFEKENIDRIYTAFPTARYKIYTIECTEKQKRRDRPPIKRMLSPAIPIPLLYHRPFLLINGKTFLPAQPLYLFLLYCKTAGKQRRTFFFQTFFAYNAQGLLRIRTTKCNIRRNAPGTMHTG